MKIRRAEKKDAKEVLSLLSQVLEVHAKLRPDLFISGSTKYREDELVDIFLDDKRPIYVAEVDGHVAGYAFVILRDNPKTNNTHPNKECYIDDICVDEKMRGKHIAKSLFLHVKEEAARLGCDVITLNVWADNEPAETFYRNMGMRPRKTFMEMAVQ